MKNKNKTLRIIPRSEHTLSRSNISPNALKVLKRLWQAGYSSNLVGGCVRDLLIGHQPKDFDIATDAHPEEIRALFKNSRLIGRRFRIVHVTFGREIIEVVTFRGAGNGNEKDREVRGGMLVRDNVYGTMDEDVWRRDFTVNALYYNIADQSVIDFMDGMHDLRNGVLRLIGTPEERYREDPARMLRVIRFSAKLGFTIDKETAEPLTRLGRLLHEIAPARLFEEVLKLFMSGHAEKVFGLLEQYQLFGQLFPLTRFPVDSLARRFFIQAMKNTDERVISGKPVTPAFLIAVSLWEPVRRRAEERIKQGQKETIAYREVASEVLQEQAMVIRQPRRFSAVAREIWMLQLRFPRRRGKRALRLLQHPRFRAGYDFLMLRIQSGESSLQDIGTWWTRIQRLEGEEQEKMAITAVRQSSGKPRKSGRRKNKGQQKADNENQ